MELYDLDLLAYHLVAKLTKRMNCTNDWKELIPKLSTTDFKRTSSKWTRVLKFFYQKFGFKIDLKKCPKKVFETVSSSRIVATTIAKKLRQPDPKMTRVWTVSWKKNLSNDFPNWPKGLSLIYLRSISTMLCKNCIILQQNCNSDLQSRRQVRWPHRYHPFKWLPIRQSDTFARCAGWSLSTPEIVSSNPGNRQERESRVRGWYTVNCAIV